MIDFKIHSPSWSLEQITLAAHMLLLCSIATLLFFKSELFYPLYPAVCGRTIFCWRKSLQRFE